MKKTKKDLKKFINENGFFQQTSCIERLNVNEANELVTLDNNVIKTKAKLPKGENIVLFRGILSQQFKKGDRNRNGYKIDINGMDWTNYNKNPQIFLQHDADNPIGKGLEIIRNEKNIELIYFVNLNWVEGEANKERIKEGAFAALSTGSIVIEYMFEHKKTGVMIEKDEYYRLSWEESKDYDLVITKSEAIENSVVSIPSNPKALTKKNNLEIFFNKNIMPNLTEKEKKENEIEHSETDKIKDVEKNEAEEEKTEEKETEKADESENDESDSDNSEEDEEKTDENSDSDEKDESENDSDDSDGEKSDDDSGEKKDDKIADYKLPAEALETVQVIVNENARLVQENAEKDVKINELQNTLDNTPNRKVRVVRQFNEKSGDDNKKPATNGIDCLKNMGVKIV